MKSIEINDNQNYWILKKLASSFSIPLKRKELEQPFFRNSEAIADSIIPHSSSINRIIELTENGSILEYDSGKISPKQLPMMEYHITPIGMIELLRLSKNKRLDDELLSGLHQFPYIELNLSELLTVFTKKQIFETLIHVSMNFKIAIDNNPFDENYQDISGFLKPVTAYELHRKKNKLIMYYIFNKFIQNGFSYTISKRIPIFGKVKNKKQTFPKTHAMISISRVFECSFFHELILRCKIITYDDYPSSKGISIVLNMIRDNNQLREEYLELLSQINNNMKFNLDSIRDIEKSLSCKNNP